MKFSAKNYIEKDLNEKIIEYADIFEDLKCTYELCIDDKNWHLDLSKPEKKIVAGKAKESHCSLELSAENFEKLAAGKLNIPLAVMMGKIKIKGSKGLALKLVELFK